MENIVASSLGANGPAMVLSVLGLLVSLPVLSGGGCSKAAVDPPHIPSANSLSDGVASSPSGLLLGSEPINIPLASFMVHDNGQCNLEITDLPSELVVNILAKLTIPDLLVCKHVCKRWQNLVTTVPALACAVYRGCHPAGYVPRVNNAIRSYHGSVRQWLNSFSKQGSRAVTQLDGVLASGGPHFSEQLFFAMAHVLTEAPAFDCRKVCTVEHPDPVYHTCFSADEQHLLSVSDYTIRICSLVNGHWQSVETFLQPALVLCAHFSPDSKHLVARFLNDDAKIWVLAEGQWQQQVDWHPVVVRSSPWFNADTTYLVTISGNYNAQIHRLIDGQWQPQVTALDHYPARGARFHPQEPDLLATHCHKAVTFWRSVDGQWQQDGTLLHTVGIFKIDFSPDGNRLMAHSRADRKVGIHVWHRVGSVWRKEAVPPLVPSVSRADFSPRGNYIVLARGQSPMEIWQLSGGRWENIDIPEPERCSADCFSPDERHLVTNVRCMCCTVVLKCADGQWHREAVIKDGLLRQTRFSPHGNHLVTTSPCSKIVGIWGIVAGAWQEKARLAHASELLIIHFSPQGSYVLTTTSDGIVNVWSLNSQQ